MRDESYPKAAIQGALPPESLIISFLVLINNLDVSTDYVQRIVDTCLGENTSTSLSDSFPFGNESIQVSKSLQTLSQSFSAKTSDLITEALEVLQKQVMRPRLRPVLVETFRDVDYNTVDDDNPRAPIDDEESVSDDVVVQRFARGWASFTLPVKRILTPNLWDRLMTGVLAYLADRLEKRMLSLHGRVSELGAIRLERDIAGIVTVAVKGAKWEARDVFQRCVQMGLVMNMEAEEWDDVVRLSEKGPEALQRETGVKWVLTKEDRKKVRGIVSGRAD
jgi:hypothetical protein